MATNSFLDLEGKCVIVTGASAGIGEAIALEFARQSCHLMLCGRDRDRLGQVAEKCRQAAPSGSHPKIYMAIGDITDSSVQQSVIDDTLAQLGVIDVLVNNAGMFQTGDYRTSREDYHRIMTTNIESIFFLTQLTVPHLVKSKGNVVNISSTASEQPSPNIVVHSMSKAALDSFTKALALNLATEGVRVNSVNPGSISGSLILRRGGDDIGDDNYKKWVEAMSSPDMHPLGRIGVPSEVADSVVFLASRRASFITGQIIFVDGGRHCKGPSPRV